MTVQILKVGDVGSFESQSLKSNPDGLSLVYIPAITLLLERAAQLKGSALSDAERKRIEHQAGVVAMPSDVAESVVKQRGGFR